MNRRERVLAALHGRRVDRIPFAMWRYHHYQCQTAQGLARATLDFYRTYHPDLIVMMPGPFYMAESWGGDVRSFSRDDVAPYVVGPVIRRVAEWRHLSALDLESCSLRREIDAVRLIRQELDDQDAPLIVPLYSPLMTADVLCNGRIGEDVRSFSTDLRSGLQVIAESTARFARACLEAGADGLLFVTDMASADRLRRREYRDYGQSYDLDAWSGSADAAIRIVMLQGEHLFFDMVERYPVQAVCWETWRADPSLTSAARQVRCSLMGGLNPSTFAAGTARDVGDQVRNAIAETGGWRLIVAPSGALPPASRPDVLSSVEQIVRESELQDL